MRRRVLHLGVTVALALAGVILLGLIAQGLTGWGHRSVDEIARPLSDVDLVQESMTFSQVGEFMLISRPLSGLSARRAISDPGINSPLVLSENGRQVLVTGHLICTSGQDYEILTSVTQRTTGALARGKAQGRCSGKAEQFGATTWVYDQALFEVGPAQACAIAITRSRNSISDVFQWCRKEDAELATARAGSSY